MIQNYKIVTLCGSTRFKELFLETQKRLTLEGCIVISVGLFGHSGDEEVWKPGTKEMLDDMHLRKIDLADEIMHWWWLLPLRLCFQSHHPRQGIIRLWPSQMASTGRC